MPKLESSSMQDSPGPLASSSRTVRTQASRQASITRPTKASDARSVGSPDPGARSVGHSRQNSIQRPARGMNTTHEVSHGAGNGARNLGPRRLHTPPQTHVSLLPKTMDKSTSMYDISNARSPVTRPQSLYKSGHSASSRSISSQVSPRRAGLGARTISPVELRRTKRNSNLLNTSGAVGEATLLSHMSSARKVSGIPSPVKPPPLSRSRPSPVPPVPQIPDRVRNANLSRTSPTKAREAFRSFSGPAISSASTRQRSATIGAIKDPAIHTARSEDQKTSFTSPVKQRVKKIVGSGRKPSSNQLQPLNLPPLNVHELGTPTVRRVKDMSERLRSTHLTSDSATPTHDSGQDSARSGSRLSSIVRTPNTVSTSVSQGSAALPSQSAPIEDSPRDMTIAGSEDVVVETEQVPTPASTTSKSRASSGFLNRLSLSRASSISKAKVKKHNSESTESKQESTPEQVTPERSRRRLSLSWVKGKMSPFGHSISVPKFDTGTPPLIPKSFTSESLASVTSDHEASISSKAAGASVVPSRVSAEGLSIDSQHRPLPVPAALLLSPVDAADDEMKRLIIYKKGSNYLAKVQAQVAALQARAVPASPVEAADIGSLDGAPLNLYEKGEAIDYDGRIFFTGQKSLSKQGGKLDATNNINFGYDDDRGDYLINPGDHFAYRYEIVDVLGKGSFGQVLRCIDYKTGSLVAVKVIRNKKRFHAQALVEINILQNLRKWDPEDKHHLIKYTDHFYFRHHLCIATDLLGINLYEYVKANDFRGCSLTIIRSFTTQILSCLSLLKKQRVIHCDLKPENILLVNIWESKIKIIDFGSSCFEDQKVYTYIQSRFYRSPEVILGMSYGLPIDMWSMGCILAELLTGYPIFPGEDEQEQLACIMEVFGPPEKHLIENSTRKKLFFDNVGKPRSVVSSKGKRRKPSSKTLSQVIKCQDEAFLDFMARCLRWNPQARLTPDDALNHPFITCKPMRTPETPFKSKKLINNAMTSLTPRALPQVPHTPLHGPRVKTYSSAYRSVSESVPNPPQNLSSPSKTPHRRVVSNLPIPRERVVT